MVCTVFTTSNGGVIVRCITILDAVTVFSTVLRSWSWPSEWSWDPCLKIASSWPFCQPSDRSSKDGTISKSLPWKWTCRILPLRPTKKPWSNWEVMPEDYLWTNSMDFSSRCRRWTKPCRTLLPPSPTDVLNATTGPSSTRPLRPPRLDFKRPRILRKKIIKTQAWYDASRERGGGGENRKAV